MDSNKRSSPRVPIKLEVEFDLDDSNPLTFVTKDISDTGIFISMLPEDQPPVGTTAHVKLKNNFEDGEEPPLLKMQVVRQSKNGIGLIFL